MLERDWTKNCFAVECENLGHHYEPAPDTGMKKRNGKPFDGQIIFLPENVQCFVEIKIQDGSMKPHQIEFADYCKQKGLYHFTIRSYNNYVVALPYNSDAGAITADNPKKLIELIRIKL